MRDELREILDAFMTAFAAMLVAVLMLSILFLIYGCTRTLPKTMAEMVDGTEYRFDSKTGMFTTGLGKMRVNISPKHFLVKEMICFNEFELDNICEFRDEGK